MPARPAWGVTGTSEPAKPFAATELLPFSGKLCLSPHRALPVSEREGAEAPQPEAGCFGEQGGTVESWEAQPVPGRTQEGLSLLLSVNPVTWNRRGQALDAGTPSLGLWRAPASQRELQQPHVSGHEPV